MMKHLPYDRAERVADTVYRLVAETVTNELADPRLSGLTVTRVRMTRDLRIARIYYHVADTSAESRKRAARGMQSAEPYLRRCITERLQLKSAPELEIFYDESVDIEERIDELMAEMKREPSHG
jgi:ribosome-binding factor A